MLEILPYKISANTQTLQLFSIHNPIVTESPSLLARSILGSVCRCAHIVHAKNLQNTGVYVSANCPNALFILGMERFRRGPSPTQRVSERFARHCQTNSGGPQNRGDHDYRCGTVVIDGEKELMKTNRDATLTRNITQTRPWPNQKTNRIRLARRVFGLLLHGAGGSPEVSN